LKKPIKIKEEITMKYGSYIPFAGLKAFGLNDKIDANDWILIDYMMDWEKSPRRKTIIHEGCEYVLLDLESISKNISIFEGMSKTTFSKRITKLKDLGLVRITYNEKRLYFRLQDICYKIKNFRVKHIAKTPKENLEEPEESLIEVNDEAKSLKKINDEENIVENFQPTRIQIVEENNNKNKIILTTTNAVEFFNLNENAEGKGNWVGFSTPLANIRGGGVVSLGDVIKGIVEQIKPPLDDPPQENPQAVEENASPTQTPSPQVGKFREILASIIRTGDLSCLYSNRLYRTTNWGYFPHPSNPEIKTTVNQMIMDMVCMNRRFRRLADEEELIAIAINDALGSGELPWETFAKVYRRWRLSGVDKIMWFVKALASEVGINLNRIYSKPIQPQPTKVEEKIPEELEEMEREINSLWIQVSLAKINKGDVKSLIEKILEKTLELKRRAIELNLSASYIERIEEQIKKIKES
jgi:DNA-binding transcriptional regulator GbsR (MarR family)